jgi:HK97 family phage major capsid protein
MKYLEILRKQLVEKQQARNAQIDAVEAIVEAAGIEARSELNETEATEYAEARSQVAAIDAEIAAIEARMAELEAVGERSQVAAQAPTFMRKVDSKFDGDVRYLRPQEARDIARKAMENKEDVRHLADDQLEKVEALIKRNSRDMDGSEVAKRMIVTENPAYRSAFTKLVTQSAPVLTPSEAEAVQRFNEFRAASLTAASGGYGVPVLIDPSIILTAQGSLNPFRKVARQVSITSNVWKGVSSAGVTWSYDGEATAVSDDAPTLAQPSITAYTARGFIPYSLEIGGDYPDFASEMAALLTSGYDELQASAFCTGNGSSAPRGILTALDANTNVEITPTTDGAFGAVDIAKVWGALPDRYKQNATWMMNHDVGNEVSSFSGSGQGSFYTVNLSEANAPQLKGRPVEFASYFSDFTGTTGASNILVVGDFRNYVIVDRVGMDVELVPHLFDVTNNRPTGQRGWFAWARHGADSVNDAAFRLLQNA